MSFLMFQRLKRNNPFSAATDDIHGNHLPVKDYPVVFWTWYQNFALWCILSFLTQTVFINKIFPLVNQTRKKSGHLLRQWQLEVEYAFVSNSTSSHCSKENWGMNKLAFNTKSTRILLPVLKISGHVVGDTEPGSIYLIQPCCMDNTTDVQSNSGTHPDTPNISQVVHAHYRTTVLLLNLGPVLLVLKLSSNILT